MKSDIIDQMNEPVHGDKWNKMFNEFVAAHLNAWIGNPTCCITETYYAAMQWLCDSAGLRPVRDKSTAWQGEGEYLYQRLKAYNNGRLCAPSRDKCKGVESLTLQYTGADPVRVEVSKDKKGKKPLGSWTVIAPGETFTITPTEGKTKLSKKTYIWIYDDASGNLIETQKIHTSGSGSEPLHLGMAFGSVWVTSVDMICKLKDECQCGGVESLTVVYQGSLSGTFAASKDKKGTKILPATIDGNELTITPMTGEVKLPKNTYIHIVDELGNIRETQKIHTSGSKPLDVDMTFDDYLVTAVDKLY